MRRESEDNFVIHPGLTYPAVLSPIQVDSSDNFARVGERLGGNSLSSALYTDEQAQLFVGKCNVVWSEIKDTPNQGVLYKFFNVCSLREKIANDIYAYYGASTAITTLARLKPYLDGTDIAKQFPNLTPCIHVMSQWIDGFKPYGYFPKFEGDHQQHYLQIGETQLPVAGLGRILAIGCFLNDEDVIGGKGLNIGYQVRTNAQGHSYAHLFKIDSGGAFDRGFELELKTKDKSKEIGSSIEQRISYKRLKIATMQDEIKFADLPSSVRQEFLLTLHAIVNTEDEVIQLFFNRAPKYVIDREIQRDDFDYCIQFLKNIRDCLKVAYADELQETQELYERLCIRFQQLNKSSQNIPRAIQILYQETIKFLPLQLNHPEHDISNNLQSNSTHDSVFEIFSPGLTAEFKRSIFSNILTVGPSNRKYSFLGKDGSLMQFCNNPDKKRLLLLGEPGSGKSVVSWIIENDFWKADQEDPSNFIPIRIELKHFSPTQVKNCIEKTLKEVYYLSFDDIKFLQKRRILFILDGYDQTPTEHPEIIDGYNKAIEKYCEFIKQLDSKWPHAKTLIICRKGHALENYFLIRNWEMHHLIPFYQHQLDEYIGSHKELTIFKKIIPSATPYLMALFLEVWPQLSQQQQSSLTPYSLYDILMKHWFTKETLRTNDKLDLNKLRQANTHSSKHKSPAQELEAAYRNLAWCMSKRRRNFAEIHPREPKKNLIIKIHDALLEPSGSNEKFHFIADLQQYFVAKKLLELLKEPLNPGDLSSVYSSFPIYKDKKLMRLWAEGYQAMDSQEMRTTLLKLVRNSRELKQGKESKWEKESMQEGVLLAANVLSLLVAAKVSLAGEDLSGIKVPGADLRGGNFHLTIFKNADLRGVCLKNAYLCGTNFHRCQMEDVNFGKHTKSNSSSSSGSSMGIKSAATSPDNRYLILGTGDGVRGIVQLCQLSNHKKIFEYTGHASWVNVIACHPNKRYFVSGSNTDEFILVWDIEQQKIIRQLPGYQGGVTCIAFSSDGEFLACGSKSGGLHVLETNNWKQVRLLQKGNHITDVVFSDDNQRIASATNEGVIATWRIKLIQNPKELEVASSHIILRSDVTNFKPGIFKIGPKFRENIIISNDFNREILIWNLTNSKLKDLQLSNLLFNPNLSGHTGRLTGVRFIDSENRYAVSSSTDHTIRVWDLNEESCIQEIMAHTLEVSNIYWNDNKQCLVSCSEDGSARIWQWQSDKKRFLLQETIGNNFLQAQGANFKKAKQLSPLSRSLLNPSNISTPERERVRRDENSHSFWRLKKRSDRLTLSQQANNSDFLDLLELFFSGQCFLKKPVEFNRKQAIDQLEMNLKQDLPELFQFYRLLKTLCEQKLQLDSIKKQVDGKNRKTIGKSKRRSLTLFGRQNNGSSFSRLGSMIAMQNQNRVEQKNHSLGTTVELQEQLNQTEKDLIACILIPERFLFFAKIYNEIKSNPNEENLLKELLEKVFKIFETYGSFLFTLKLKLYKLFFLTASSTLTQQNVEQLMETLFSRLGNATSCESIKEILEEARKLDQLSSYVEEAQNLVDSLNKQYEEVLSEFHSI